MPSIISLTYQLELTTDSQMYSQGCDKKNVYYETLELKVPEIRYYMIQSSGNIDTVGYIYENNFNPLNPTENLIASNDEGGDSYGQFKIEIFLYVDTTYILVVTTHSPKEIGEIKITFLGSTDVTIKRLSE
jgi:hypothetical protein